MYAGYALFTGQVYKFYRDWDSMGNLELIAIYLGNLVGVCMVILIAAPIGIASEAIVSAAAAKLVIPGLQLFFSSIACNILIAMAVERKTPLGWFIPIFFFVAAGFEHSIADMFYLLYAVAIGSIGFLPAVATIGVVTLGNVVGAFMASIGRDMIKEV